MRKRRFDWKASKIEVLNQLQQHLSRYQSVCCTARLVCFVLYCNACKNESALSECATFEVYRMEFHADSYAFVAFSVRSPHRAYNGPKWSIPGSPNVHKAWVPLHFGGEAISLLPIMVILRSLNAKMNKRQGFKPIGTLAAQCSMHSALKYLPSKITLFVPSCCSPLHVVHSLTQKICGHRFLAYGNRPDTFLTCDVRLRLICHGLLYYTRQYVYQGQPDWSAFL